ncbi:hypothetical protein PZ897_20270 [Hoeflea sp. YIM 152468]|uniref:hypothetical protein n=1 Tax=Hoeflea sp. YIM 152468 TaxID=3031759 RepID=UPI0023DB98C2|nr:hypothetical protein [Hoeflea sp. YIM 152468]MDF1610523.1 hypothetical protein [Hoeflea sp. YIM 152468]
MISRNARRKAAETVKERAKKRLSGALVKCAVLGCQHATQKAAGNGLSKTHCKAHVEFHRRHGSYWRRSYLAREIAPFRRAARQWLREHEGSPEVLDAIDQLDGLLFASGRPISAFNLNGRSSVDKAQTALARLREAGKTGEDLLEIALTISATVSELGPRGNDEFLNVQVAKLAHRLASGTILKNHEGVPYSEIYKGAKGSMFVRYPRAAGGYMRLLGQAILKRASGALERETIQAIRAGALSTASGVGNH